MAAIVQMVSRVSVWPNASEAPERFKRFECRLGSCLVALALACVFACAFAEAAFADGDELVVTENGVSYTCVLENGEATLTHIAKAEGNDAETYEAVIPESVREGGEGGEDCLITAIASNVMGTSYSNSVVTGEQVESDYSLTRVVVPSKCLSIADQAFICCKALAKLEFAHDEDGASYLESIGYQAFAYTDIDSLDLPDSLGYVGSRAFYDCGEMARLRLPARQTVWGEYVFTGAPVLDAEIPEGCVTVPHVGVRGTSLTLPSTVQGSVAIGGPNVTSVNLPSEALFDKLTLTFASLDSLAIPEGVTTLSLSGDCPNIAFPGSLVKIEKIKNGALTDFVVPASVEEIGDFGLYGCRNLRSLSFEEGSRIRYIDSYAFSGLERLKSIELPEGLTKVGLYAFSKCPSLREVTIPASLQSGTASVFDGCDGLTSLRYASGSHKSSVGRIAQNCASLEVVALPDSVTRVARTSSDSSGSLALDCPKLKTVVILNPDVELQEGDFTRCGDFAVVGWGAAGKLVSSTEAIGREFRPIAELDGSGFNGKANTAVVATGADSVRAVCAFGGSGNFPYVRTLVEGVDYSVERVERDGLAYLAVTGMGDACCGSVEVAALQDISQAEAGIIDPQVSWNGAAARPSVKLVLGGRPLVRGRDFTVEYRNSDRAGMASAVATGVGSYTGQKEVQFEVAERHEPTAAGSDAASRVDAALAAAALSGMPETCETVVVAWAHDHAAVAAASALAVAEDAQLLVVSNAGGLTSAQKAAVSGWGATRALVVGGAAACGSGAVGDLKAAGLACEEVGASAGGAAALSVAVASAGSGSWGSAAVVANPADPAMCLAAAAYAGAVRGPLVFTGDDGTLSAEAASALAGFFDVAIAGDFAAVDASLESSLPAGATAFRAESASALVAHGKKGGIYSTADATYAVAARDASANMPYAASAGRAKAPLTVYR